MIEAFNTKLWGKWVVNLLDRKDKEYKYIKSLDEQRKEKRLEEESQRIADYYTESIKNGEYPLGKTEDKS